MSKAPAMPMYWDAYLADTTHLTTEEHGAYMLLLAAMWRRNGSVLDDDKDNARILGLTPAKWRKVKARFVATISGFHADGDTITQEKLRKTWENTQEKIAKNVVNGAKGGRAAASKINDLDQANATETLKPKASIPEPEPEPEPELKKEDTSVSLWEKPESVDDVSRAVTHFNATADKVGWQKVQKLSQPRRTALLGRFKDCGGFEQWAEAIDRAAVAPHLIGDNDRGWTASFDWLAKPANFIKLMEGNYDKRANPTRPRNSGRPNPHRSMFAAFCAESADDDGAGPEYGGDMRDITPARF
jgi:uncharacterized protein YdaU (DUF1376 family)